MAWTVTAEAAAAAAWPEDSAEVAAASATSATGSGTSPGSAARRRTGATSATVGRLSVAVDGVTLTPYSCAGTGHIARNCSQEEDTCYNCNQVRLVFGFKS